MKVILQQDVKGQGKKGQLIEASDGYARNFLLPRKLAVPATAENINTMKMQEKAKAAQMAAEKAEAEATAAKLKELSDALRDLGHTVSERWRAPASPLLAMAPLIGSWTLAPRRTWHLPLVTFPLSNPSTPLLRSP